MNFIGIFDRRKSAIVTGCLALSFVFALFFAPSVASAAGERVSAVYRISFNGLDLGQFVFQSSNRKKKYVLSGHAQISALLGAFNWRSTTRSTGKITRVGYKPDHYAFNFKSNKKRGGVNMRFAGNSVTQVLSRPPVKKSRRRVPIQRSHLKGVLDPMSAILALTDSRNGKVAGVNPCTKRNLRVFDGKQRFDLRLSFKRMERLSSRASRGSPNIAFVCRIKYVPVSGHKMNSETKFMSKTNDIEIWLRPVPRANMFIPYYIGIPTMFGTASLTSNRVNIDLPGIGRIALVN